MIGVRFYLRIPQSYTDIRTDTWGFADVQGAVAAIPDWIDAMEWEGPNVSLKDWLISGHSNGGKRISCLCRC